MDEIDKKLTSILRKNGRASYTEMARQVSLTEGAVRRRVGALVSSGDIRRFSAVLASEARAIVLAKLDPKVAAAAIASIKQAAPDIFETSGAYDLAILLDAESVEEINKKVDRIRAVKGVASTDTLMKLA